MSIFTTIEDSDTDRSEIERKSFSIWRFICYLQLENEGLQLHSKPFYSVSYYLLGLTIYRTLQTLYYGSEKIAFCCLNRQTSVVIPGADCFST